MWKRCIAGVLLGVGGVASEANARNIEPVSACIIPQTRALSELQRQEIARCLGWEERSETLCKGVYQPINIPSPRDDTIKIQADKVTLAEQGYSRLSGQVEVHETDRILTAQTALIYRDKRTGKITQIELLDGVNYREPGRLMLAQKARFNPQDKSGKIEQVLYRFDTQHARAQLPAWGRARVVQRLANQNYYMQQATYTTCAPQDKAWYIEAEDITLDEGTQHGVAKGATLRLNDWPVLYSPYLSFPTSKTRKSGFLMPFFGYSNVGGFDWGMPYYWNIAPNYDATIVPHLYTRRGVMLGGDFRFLTADSSGRIGADFLPKDRAFGKFIQENQAEYASLRGLSNNRWSLRVHDETQLNPQFQARVNFQQVSDDYYLQDFSSNLAVATQNQLLRQGDLTYTSAHWLVRGMLQSYQTLQPITQSFVSPIYERLPQLMARGHYSELPLNGEFSIVGQFDYFRWPKPSLVKPQGPRYHVNPVVAFPHRTSWGYIKPAVEWVGNRYDVSAALADVPRGLNRSIPRYSVEGGAFFERFTQWQGQAYTQTLEPQLYYLNVPYRNQQQVPVFDSAYMIFNYDQLFRTNRFSGFDRIGDTNQLTYALTSRWLSDATGQEKASFSIGQIRYFSQRQVELCYLLGLPCHDNELMLGHLSPDTTYSPVASRLSYRMNSHWMLGANYVWDGNTRSTNNADLNFHYQPKADQLLSFGYTYLVNGDVMAVASHPIQDNALHQATLSYAVPLSEQWSHLGVYSYNISKHYGMTTFLGLQYDSCCWAARVLGGRTFRSISPVTLLPQYNNNVFFQVLLKGLGTAASGDAASTINSYLPGYVDLFQRG